jgi:hypothetical protein
MKQSRFVLGKYRFNQEADLAPKSQTRQACWGTGGGEKTR